jgi:hypothetical protein
MKNIAVIFVLDRANDPGERRLPACSVRQPAERILSDARQSQYERIAIGQAARQNRLAAYAPQPFWTWFIDNPRPSSLYPQ